MRKLSTPIFAVLVTMLLFLAFAGMASARNFRVNEKEFIANWEPVGEAKAELTATAAGQTAVCSVRLDGAFRNETIAKTTGITIGEITGFSRVMNCSSGVIEVLPGTLPAPIRYQAFAGRLPSIERIILQVLNLGIEVTFGTIRCLYQTEALRPAKFIVENFEASGGANTLRAEESASIPARGVCSLVGGLTFSGMSLLRERAAEANKVSIRLI